MSEADAIYNSPIGIVKDEIEKIVAVVGNLGAGKTTFTRLICERSTFTPDWEKPGERPFHLAFGKDVPRWALVNQLDFLLFRGEQEGLAKKSNGIAVFDGGFDQDFHVYTRYIAKKGYLNPQEFEVCASFYQFVRVYLPPPDLVIRVIVDLPTYAEQEGTARQEDG